PSAMRAMCSVTSTTSTRFSTIPGPRIVSSCAPAGRCRSMILRWDAPDAATLRRVLVDLPRPVSPLRSTHFRDVYFDTSDGELRTRGARCRLRFTADGDRWLTLWQPERGGARIAERVREVDAAAALNGTSPPAVRLRALIDPARLLAWIERDVDRTWRTLRLPVIGVPLCDVVADA